MCCLIFVLLEVNFNFGYFKVIEVKDLLIFAKMCTLQMRFLLAKTWRKSPPGISIQETWTKLERSGRWVKKWSGFKAF